MRGLIFDIKRFALHDGPGIRTTIFLKGCPLRCWWCQNPESIREFPEIIQVKSLSNNHCIIEDELFGNEFSSQSLLEEINKDRVFFDDSGGGVTFSGGEPLVQFKFLSEILYLCKSSGISTAVDTSGYAPKEAFEEIYKNTDLFLYDLKLINDNEHVKFTEVSNKLILENLKRLTDFGDKVVIRVPLIPDITDTPENLSGIAEFVNQLKNVRQIDLLPYNKIAESKYKRFNRNSMLGEKKTQTNEKLKEIKSIFNNYDLEIIIRG